MWAEFESFLTEHQLLRENDRVLLAMSGGVDSVVLAHLFLRKGIAFAVAHANFKLRGSASDGDEQFVVDWANRNGIEVFTKTFDVANRPNGISVQQAAREARYGWFFERMAAGNFTRLATAHHASDNVETLFINILRGAGVRGWSGIPLNENKIIRPLLFADKVQILNWAEQEGISYREDATNAQQKYLRNQIRHRIIPELVKISPGLEKRVSQNELQLQRAADLLDFFVKENNSDALRRQGNSLEVMLDRIDPQQYAVEVLFVLLRAYGFSHLQLGEAWNSQEPGKLFHSVRYSLLVDRQRWLIKPLTAETRETDPVDITPDLGEVIYPIHLRIAVHSASGFVVPTSPKEAALDIDKLVFPLTLRPWERGDRFIPLGMSGHKLVSDYLIDAKVDRFEKEHTFVIASAGEIVWLVGHRIAETVRISQNTKEVLLLSLVE